MRWVGFAAGLFVILATAGSVLTTLVLPRGLRSRLSVFVSHNVAWRMFLLGANRFSQYEAKDRVLALSAPVALLLILVTWLLLFLAGYALVLWPLIDGSFGQALREAGSSLLTLGFAATADSGAAAVHFLAASTGLIVVALEISYLPVIYSAFNRRETLITLLQSRAGAPAWGPEILRRHKTVELLDNLPDFYAGWERWAADVAETHANYPVLVWFRSPHPLRSWVTGLLAVLDSAALYQSMCPESAPKETRLFLRMGFLCLRDIASVVGIDFDRDPFPDDPIQLEYEDFLGAIHLLADAQFPMERSPEEAWDHFRGWRVNYEAVAYALADQVVAPPGPWSGPRHHLPGLEIVPQRPADRTPGDSRVEERPRGSGAGW